MELSGDAKIAATNQNTRPMLVNTWKAVMSNRLELFATTAIQCVSTGLDNMRDPGILDPRHFFFPRHFYTIYAIFTQFYTILHDFCAIFHDFCTILRDFCDFYAIFCQAKILASQAPKTIIQAWTHDGD